jgi:hypothetical protein
VTFRLVAQHLTFVRIHPDDLKQRVTHDVVSGTASMINCFSVNAEVRHMTYISGTKNH